MSQNSITVSELNQIIKTLIDGEPILNKVCVRGELSNYKIYPSGHHYFTLKDAESSLRCVMFKSSASKLRFAPKAEWASLLLDVYRSFRATVRISFTALTLSPRELAIFR